MNQIMQNYTSEQLICYLISMYTFYNIYDRTARNMHKKRRTTRRKRHSEQTILTISTLNCIEEYIENEIHLFILPRPLRICTKL